MMGDGIKFDLPFLDVTTKSFKTININFARNESIFMIQREDDDSRRTSERRNSGTYPRTQLILVGSA